MKETTYELKYIMSAICDALNRNLNNNFVSISFMYSGNGAILLKVILDVRSHDENEYIADMTAEFEAICEYHRLTEIIVDVGRDKLPFEHVVYEKTY